MFVKANRGWLLLAHIPYKGEHFDEYLGLTGSRDNKRTATIGASVGVARY